MIDMARHLNDLDYSERQALDAQAGYYGVGQSLFNLFDSQHQDYLRAGFLKRTGAMTKRTKPNATLKTALRAIKMGGPFPDIDWGNKSFEQSARDDEDDHGFNREKQIWFSKTGVKNCRNLAQFGAHQFDIDGIEAWKKNLSTRCPNISNNMLKYRLNSDSSLGFWMHSYDKNSPEKGSGFGKTSYSIALLHEYRKENPGKSVKAVQWKDFVNIYDKRFGDGTKDFVSGDSALVEMQAASVLLIDEMPERLTEAKQLLLFDLLDARINRADFRKTLFTSNYSLDIFYHNLDNPGLKRRLIENLNFVCHVTNRGCLVGKPNIDRSTKMYHQPSVSQIPRDV